MSQAADALQPFLVRALISLSGRLDATNLPDVITAGRRAGFDLDFDAANQTIEIDFREQSYVASAIGGDACRFASASFTSLSAIGPAFEDRTSLAWGMIRLYYAAFYAGHSVLRLLGQSCSFLENSHVSRLKRLATTEPGFNIEKGLYHCRLNKAQTGFNLVRARGTVGGAHESFWKIFGEFLEALTEDVIKGHLPPRDAREVFVKLDAVRAILQFSGGASAG
jgi:hypothetical protein